ncbi:MAG: porin [Zoogloeaceae bacterium]|jgi:predicted porin|nr:porin [Zoogloeaceae bacterium]
MQKKLIAAAIAGLIAVPVMAQTNVTISGRMATGWESYKLSGGKGVNGYDTESKVSDQSSRVIFNVVEDLGNGLSAWGQWDLRWSPVDSRLGGDGNSGLGLMSKSWGKFTMGKWDVHYQEFDANIGGNRAGTLQTLLGNGLMSQVNGNSIASGTRTPNLLMWDSPNWGGVTARLAYSTSFTNDEGQTNRGTGNPGAGRAWTGALRYNNAGLALGASYWNGNQEDRAFRAAGTLSATDPGNLRTIDQRSWRLWGGYTFGFGLKVGLGYDRSSLKNNPFVGNSTTNKRSAWFLPVSYEFGANKVYFTYAKAGDASNTVGDTGAKAYVLGYDYAFSKRTSAGVFYTKLKNNNAGSYDLFALGANGASATNAGEDVRQIYFGVAHNF